MNYDEIKAGLANARSYLDRGDVAEAHRIIMGLHGITPNDIDVGLTSNQKRQLREYQKQHRGSSASAKKPTTAKVPRIVGNRVVSTPVGPAVHHASSRTAPKASRKAEDVVETLSMSQRSRLRNMESVQSSVGYFWRSSGDQYLGADLVKWTGDKGKLTAKGKRLVKLIRERGG